MPRKQQGPPPNVLEGDETEALTPEEQAATEAEASAPVEAAPPAEEPQQQQPPAEAKPEEKLTEREGFPEETTPAQKRIQALIEERDRARQERAELQERWARMDERKRVMEEAGRQAQEEAARREQAAQRPDPDVDPVGARLWDQEQRLVQMEQARAEEQRQYQTWVQGQQQQAEQQRIQYEVENWRANQEAMFKQTTPDYGTAVDYLHAKRLEHWQMMGNNADEAEKMWLRERFAYVAQTKFNQDRGYPTKNFGEVVYKLAQDLGYRGNGNPVPNGTANPQAQRVEQIKAAQQRQGLGGKTSPASGTDEIQSIGAMTLDQFSVWLDRNFPDGEDLLALQQADPQKYAAIERRMKDLG